MSDNPFHSKSENLLQFNNIFKFITRGFPRIIMIVSFYVIAYILYYFIKNNSKLTDVLKTYSQILLYLSGYKKINIDQSSKELIDNNKAQIIVVNHSSYIDIGVMNTLFPKAKFIASNYIKNLPVIGKHARHNCIFLKKDFNSNLTETISEYIKNGETIIYFSEGCCSRPDILLKLRRGAFVHKIPILPVHINYNEENIWINGQDNMLVHYLWQLCQKTNNVDVRVGKIYEPSKDEQNDVDIFIKNFSDYYSKTFGVSLSDKEFRDHPYLFPKKN